MAYCLRAKSLLSCSRESVAVCNYILEWHRMMVRVVRGRSLSLSVWCFYEAKDP